MQSAVRSLVRDCLMMKRSRSRHRARRELEAVGARLVGALLILQYSLFLTRPWVRVSAEGVLLVA